MLKFLGRFGKGWATVTGIVTVVVGQIWGTSAAESVVAVGDAVPTIITAVGGVVASFGIGRKAGATLGR